MKDFAELIDGNNRKKALLLLAKKYNAEAVMIFVKDPEVQIYLPILGVNQTLVDAKQWHDLLSRRRSSGIYRGKVKFPSVSEAKELFLASHKDKIAFAIIGGSISDSQLADLKGVLPFLAVILISEKNEKYSAVRLAEAEKAVVENKKIAERLDSTRLKLRAALIKTREEMEAIKKAREYKEQVGELTRQRNSLLTINKIKDDFISLASHQLRTPATVVKQYIGLLADGYAGNLTPKQNKFLQIANDSNEVQLDILNDLLKTAQLDSADMNHEKKMSPLKPLISGVIKQFSSAIDYKKQTLIVECPEAPVVAPVHQDDIKLALANLIENATKYSRAGKRIWISLATSKQMAHISVKDEGVGIKPEDYEGIFGKFTRSDNELTDIVPGSGLGLYLVRRVAELHGGEVSVKSKIGYGSEFTIELPLK